MSTAVAFLDRLYTSYILRDVLGKALPGLVVIVAMAFSPNNAQPVLFLFGQVSPAGWVVVIALALTLGFGVQALGESVGWSPRYPEGGAARAAAVGREIAIGRAGDAWAIQRRERHLALREVAGTFSFGLVVAVVLVGASYLPAPLPLIAKGLVALAAAGALFLAQRREAGDQHEFEQQLTGPATRRSRRATGKRS